MDNFDFERAARRLEEMHDEAKKMYEEIQLIRVNVTQMALNYAMKIDPVEVRKELTAATGKTGQQATGGDAEDQLVIQVDTDEEQTQEVQTQATTNFQTRV